MIHPHRILCIVAHYDDEVLICGVTLLKWAEQGSENRVLFFTSPDTGRTTGFFRYWQRYFSPRLHAAQHAARLLHYNDNKMTVLCYEIFIYEEFIMKKRNA